MKSKKAPALEQAGNSTVVDPCVPSGLDRLFEMAGDDVATLQAMLLVMQQILAKRNDREKTVSSDNRPAPLTRG